MASLYELDQAVLTVLDNGLIFDEETGEILWDEDNFNQLEVERNDKLEAVALYVKSLDADAAAIKAEEKKLADRRSIKERKAERLRSYLTFSMQTFGDTKIETPRVALSFRKSESVEITDASYLPRVFCKIEEKITPDKKAIKQALKAGETINGAELVTRQNLQIK